MNGGWWAFIFGGGTWTWWYGILFLALLMLMGTAIYACQVPSGPGAGPFIMLGVFFVAFVMLTIVSTVDVAWWAGASGSGLRAKILFVLATWVAVGLLWPFLFWATDPNYPERLLPGRLLFTLHALLLYAGNLWLLWRLRPA
jgi:hypothetical protein